MVETAKQAANTLAKAGKDRAQSVLSRAMEEGLKLRQENPAAYVQQIMGDPGWQTSSGIRYTGGGTSNAQYSNAADVLSQSSQPGIGVQPQFGTGQ